MTEKLETTPATAKSAAPAKMIREGAIAASIWLREAAEGLPYYTYTLSRSYKSKASGKEGYSTSFFASNAKAIARVTEQAEAWIADQAGQVRKPESSRERAAA